MPNLYDIAQFDAGRSIGFAEAGRKQRTLAELGSRAAAGDYRGAEQAAWAGGQPEWAQQLNQMTRQQHEQMVEDTARFALSADTPEKWDAGKAYFMETYGADPGDFRLRQAMIDRAVPMADAIRMQREDAERARAASASAAADARKPPEIDEFYDEQTGLPYKAAWNPLTRSYDRVGGNKAPSGGMSLTTNPDGTVSLTQGGSGGKLTEADYKSSIYATRAAGALPLINTYGSSLTNLPQSFVGSAPVVGNYFRDADFQRAENAGLEFLQAILRKDTGAAITPAETAEYGKVYLPRPGDTPEVLQQKAAARDRALQALMAGMPAQAILNSERALGSSLPAPPQPPGRPSSFAPLPTNGAQVPPSIGPNGGVPGGQPSAPMPLGNYGMPVGQPAPQQGQQPRIRFNIETGDFQ